MVFRPDGEWEAECLQIMTNVPEKEYKVDETAENVYVIEEGDEIPLTLPEGKTVYYFKKGIHTLPGGYWAELDLGKTETVTSLDLMTPSVNQSTLPGGLCFELLAKQEDGAWESVYRSVGEDAENNVNLTGVKVNAEARYFRIVLHGNFNWQPVGNYRFIHKAYMSELRLFNESGENVALGRAVAGAGKDFAVITDGAEGDVYGHAYAGETFSVMDGYTYYLEKGSVLNGAFLGNGRENVTISGRGILDSSILESDHDLSEGRNGAIHFEYLKNVVVEGITMMHAPMWMCVINYSENVLVDGVNLFGYCTNADGIHFSASKNAVATGCFIRTTDDLFVAYHYGDADGLTFRNSVLWSDGEERFSWGSRARETSKTSQWKTATSSPSRTCGIWKKRADARRSSPRAAGRFRTSSSATSASTRSVSPSSRSFCRSARGTTLTAPALFRACGWRTSRTPPSVSRSR